MAESDFKRWFKGELESRISYWLRFRDRELYLIEPKTSKRSAPDLIVLGPTTWAALEFKISRDADWRPNQNHNINKLSLLSYAKFVYPENAEEVLSELENLFGVN